jgi:RNA polymerase sigma-70 factor (ECF subfamily)
MAATWSPNPGTGEPPAPAKSGTLPSFLAIYKEYFRFVWSCTRRMGVPEEAMDDVVQEVFIVVHSRHETVESREVLQSWLYGVVRRTVLAFHRRRRERMARDGKAVTLGDPALGPTPLDKAMWGEDVKLLWSILEQLGEAKQEVLILADLQEMSVPEIAEMVGIPLNTAYSRLRQARLDFDQELQRRRRCAPAPRIA